MLSTACSSPLVCVAYLQGDSTNGDCDFAVSYFVTGLNVLQGW